MHQGRVQVVLGDYEGKADVSDRVTVEFTWDVKRRRVVGAVMLTDGKTRGREPQSRWHELCAISAIVDARFATLVE